MSLFGALSEMVGGVVLAAAPACDLALPQATLGERARFIAWLSVRDEIREIRSIVEALGRDIWMGEETRGLAQGDLGQHVLAASDVISNYPPHMSMLAEIASAARAGGAGEPVAKRIAADLVARSRGNGDLARQGLVEEILFFLIERAFTHLIANKGALHRLGAALADYAHERESLEATAAYGEGTGGLGISRHFLQRIEALGGRTFLADLGERNGLTEHAMRRLVALIDAQPASADDPITRLEQLCQWLGEVRAQLLRPTNDEVEVRRRKTAAATALADGDFEAAMEALRNVRRELREARRRTEERLQDDAIALRNQMLEEARATGRLAELISARGEHAHAAELFAEAALVLPRSERELAWRFNLKRATALLEASRQHNDAVAMTEALTAFASLVRQAAEGTNTRALAEACAGHGDALLMAGERETGVGRLKDAVTIYQKAIQLLERERESALLLRTRLAIAKALSLIAERDRSPEVLERAAEAFRSVSSQVSAEERPAEYATVKLGLGSMLVLLALEEKDGARLLDEAAEAYEAALDVLDPENDTEKWGEAQFNLGLAALGIGEQEASATHLEQAARAFRAAIEAMPRIRVPQRWALAQMNLGNALAALGDLDLTTSDLIEQAIEAYTASLEEIVRESDPLKWAITQMNLGGALIKLGERKDKRRHWLAAASALVPALEVFEEQRADNFAEMTRRNLKRFQDSWDSFIGMPAKSEVATDADAPSTNRESIRLAGSG